jgi:hypothetical protein
MRRIRRMRETRRKRRTREIRENFYISPNTRFALYPPLPDLI